MADINLITLLRPIQGVQPSQAVQSSPSEDGKVLVDLPTGSMLSGFILNRDASGNPILRTSIGDIPFASQFFLKIGSEVTIRVDNSGDGNRAHILSVDGQPPQEAEQLSSFAHDPDVVLGEHISDRQPGQVQTLKVVPETLQEPIITVKGTLISLPQERNAFTPSLPVGTQLTLKLVSLAQPTANTTPSQAPASNPPSSLSYAAYTRSIAVDTATVTVAAQSLSQPNPTLPAALAASDAVRSAPSISSELTGNAFAVTSTSASITNNEHMPFNAVVTAQDPGGEVLLQSPIGTIRLQPDATFQTGAHVVLTLEDALTPAAPNPLTNLLPAPLVELAQQWMSLQQIALTLSPNDGTTDVWSAQSAAMNGMIPAAFTLPATSPISVETLTDGLLFFLSSLRKNDFDGWIGRNNSKALQAEGQDSVLKKAAAEFSSIARSYEQPAPHSWQALFFPVTVDGMVQQIRFFTKRDRDEDSEEPDKETGEHTRFVVEMDLSRLGEIQMDGFVRRANNATQFDMVIRSLAPLPEEMQQELLRIYHDTGALSGYKGSLSFQFVKAFPVNPMQDIVSVVPDVIV